MAQLRIGTCSWKYDSWRGMVYSGGEKINYLKEYSALFNTVEIDQWFWSLGEKSVRLPKPEVVRAYKLSIPDDFKFSVKNPNSVTLTHFYQKKIKNEPLQVNKHFLSHELFDQFLFSIAEIKQNLGPLMFQFEYLNKQKMATQFDFQVQFSEFIRNFDQDYQFAIEIRNPNYLNKTYFEFLNNNDLIHVFLEGYYMPHIYEIYDKFKEFITDTVVIRLHGPDRKGIEKKSGGNWDKIIEPKDTELHYILDMIKDLLSKDVDVYLNVNNHYEGSAPLTIKKIRDLL